ncbi:MAG: efflux RND transporter periplasmic adaptor subunit [Acidobacteria bacterium]|nr:efflux RND transporter periplasmic adaptor subunit [Acidobacteriota bacterium]
MNMKRVLFGGGVIAVAGIAASLYFNVLGKNGILEGSGTVEARNIHIGSKIGGRIQEVRVREGDKVTAGQILVTFEEQELWAAYEQSKANLEKMERGFRPEEIAEARAGAAEAAADLDLHKRGYRKEEIDQAKAEVERTQAQLNWTAQTVKRAQDLSAQGVFSKQQMDDAEGNWKMAQAQLDTAKHKLEELVRGYRPEEIAGAEAKYQQTKATLEKMEHGNRREDIDQARAALLLDEARYKERQVLAPANAVVEVMDIRPGDLIAPNTPIATLLEEDQIYVRIYIPETEIARVQVGQKGEVHTDSLPGETFSAEVEQINQRAEFLPRNVQTKTERVHQVFGVKLRIHDKAGHIRAGMSADVRLLPTGK